MRWKALLLAALLSSCGQSQRQGDGGTDARSDGSDVGTGDADDPWDGDLDDGDADSIGDADDGGAARCSIAAVVDAISADRIRATVAALTAMPDRATPARQEQAANLLAAELDAAGATYRDQRYSWNGQSWRNIEIELTGGELSSELYLAGAHYDSASVGGSAAPGADDNAAGAAAIVELARVLAGCSYRRTLRLVLFSNEEVGTVGSQEYAGAARRAGDDIRAYLNLDMIAYGPADEDLDIATRPTYAWLANRVEQASERWAGLPAVTIVNDHCG